MQKSIIHQYIDIVIITRHLYMILSSHESEACTHFHKEFLHMLHQTDFHVTFIILLCESQHIKYIWVFEH